MAIIVFSTNRDVTDAIGNLTKEVKRMADATTDLVNAVTRLNSSVSAELTAIADKLASFGTTVTASDVENAVASINAVADKLDAETAALTPTPPPVA